MTFRKVTVTLPLLALLLAGCDESQLSPATRSALCAVAYGPIKYNTYNKASGRYAGPVLAPDLKLRNQIGQRLGCPQYKRSVVSAAEDNFRKW